MIQPFIQFILISLTKFICAWIHLVFTSQCTATTTRIYALNMTRVARLLFFSSSIRRCLVGDHRKTSPDSWLSLLLLVHRLSIKTVFGVNTIDHHTQTHTFSHQMMENAKSHIPVFVQCLGFICRVQLLADVVTTQYHVSVPQKFPYSVREIIGCLTWKLKKKNVENITKYRVIICVNVDKSSKWKVFSK